VTQLGDCSYLTRIGLSAKAQAPTSYQLQPSSNNTSTVSQRHASVTLLPLPVALSATENWAKHGRVCHHNNIAHSRGKWTNLFNYEVEIRAQRANFQEIIVCTFTGP